MVLLMIPGLGFLYSGLARRKSALSMIWACMGSFSIITIQWYFWGYSLAFSSTATNGFIGNLKHFGMMTTLGAPSPGSPLVPELLYAFYQVGEDVTTERDPGLLSKFPTNYGIDDVLCRHGCDYNGCCC